VVPAAVLTAPFNRIVAASDVSAPSIRYHHQFANSRSLARSEGFKRHQFVGK